MLSELRLNLDPAVEAPAQLGPLIDPEFHSCGSVEPHGGKSPRPPREELLHRRHEELRTRPHIPHGDRLRTGPLHRSIPRRRPRLSRRRPPRTSPRPACAPPTSAAVAMRPRRRSTSAERPHPARNRAAPDHNPARLPAVCKNPTGNQIPSARPNFAVEQLTDAPQRKFDPEDYRAMESAPTPYCRSRETLIADTALVPRTRPAGVLPRQASRNRYHVAVRPLRRTRWCRQK